MNSQSEEILCDLDQKFANDLIQRVNALATRGCGTDTDQIRVPTNTPFECFNGTVSHWIVRDLQEKAAVSQDA